LVFAGITGIAAGMDCCGHFIAGIAIWFLAGLLLQTIPVKNGVQFIPLPPWYYRDLARIVSCAVWLGIIVGTLLMFSNAESDRGRAVGIFLAAMAINAVLLSFATPADVTTAEERPQIKSSEDEIVQWERLQSDRQNALDRLMSDQEALIGRIRGLGAKSKQELMANPVGQTLVAELEQLVQQINAAKKEIEVVETAIERAKSRLRSIERQTMLKSGELTDDEYKRMSVANHTLADERRQPPGSEIHRDKLLDALFSEEK
jgi:hypothetical protein